MNEIYPWKIENNLFYTFIGNEWLLDGMGKCCISCNIEPVGLDTEVCIDCLPWYKLWLKRNKKYN
jgi:hypothetical protein